MEDITRIVDGCVQVGLFNDELYRKHRVLTSAAIQQDYLKLCGMAYIRGGVRSFGQLIHKVIIHYKYISLCQEQLKKVSPITGSIPIIFMTPKSRDSKINSAWRAGPCSIFIVNEIHRVEGYYMIMDSDGLFDVSDYSRMDEQRIAGIVDYCAELGLFDKGLWRSRQVLTSEEIQNRYMGICKSIHRKPSISDDYLL